MVSVWAEGAAGARTNGGWEEVAVTLHTSRLCAKLPERSLITAVQGDRWGDQITRRYDSDASVSTRLVSSTPCQWLMNSLCVIDSRQERPQTHCDMDAQGRCPTACSDWEIIGRCQLCGLKVETRQRLLVREGEEKAETK